jgi:DNA-binding transcriptional ArsR family regulator
MMDELQIPERLEITDLETLKALSDPLRLDILKQVGILNRKGERCTVKQLGKVLGMPPTKLYYHVNLLEEHELLVVGDTKVVSGIIEKHYQVCAMNISVSQDLMAMNESDDRVDQLAQIVQSIEEMINGSVQNLRTSLETIFEEVKLEKEEGIAAREQIQMDVNTYELVLTRQQAQEYIDLLAELRAKFSELSAANLKSDDKETLFFGITQMLVPHYHRSSNPNNPE